VIVQLVDEPKSIVRADRTKLVKFMKKSLHEKIVRIIQNNTINCIIYRVQKLLVRIEHGKQLNKMVMI
jgi:hypothetical protein